MQGHLDSAQCQQQTEQDLNTTFQKKCAQLEEEEQRWASVSQVNHMLREQLDQAGTVNQGLTESLWKAREDVDLSDVRLRREQETCASRLSREQARVRALWRQAASLRSTFNQLRTSTDRTLSDMRGECGAASRQLHVACMDLEARVTQESTSSGVEVSALESQLKDKLTESMQLQGCWDTERVKLNSKILELTDTVKHLRSQNSEKDSSLSTMQSSLDRMETRRTEEQAEMELLYTETQALQKMLFHVHQVGDGSGSEHVSSSPVRTILMAVQHGLSEHQNQTQERDAERKELEQKVLEVRRESQEVKSALDESLRDSNRHRCSVELLSSEKRSLESLLSGLQQEVDSQHATLEVLRGSTLELQRQHDLLRQQREDVERQLACQRTEAQRGERSLEELEGRLSDVRRELVTVMKEALSQRTLQKEVLENDRASLALALSKMESQCATHELALTNLKNQEAAVKDSLAKMAALSEGLAEDKVELNRIVLQTEGEKTQLGERRREAEAERAAAREETARVQQEMMNLLAEKQALESSRGHMQDLCQKLEAELSLLQKESAQAQEQHAQVNWQMQDVCEELCACRKELQTQTTGLKRASHDREELAKDRAALHARLKSADRKACGIAQEMVALRAEKESLETALFESQELASSLEAQCTRKEGERRSLLLANEALTRDAARMREDGEQRVERAVEAQTELEKKLAQVERKTLLTLSNTEQLHREQLEAERQLKVQSKQYAELTVEREQAEEQLRRQCAEQLRSQKELQQVQEEVARLQQDFNQSLLQAESEKQQALSQKEAEKAALTEKLAALQQELATAGMKLECMQREARTKHEQDKNATAVLRSELHDLRSQFEESLKSHENAKRSLIEQVKELYQLREHTQQELEGAKDGLLKARTELMEAHRELQECELRALIKRAESDNNRLRRAFEERDQKVSCLRGMWERHAPRGNHSPEQSERAGEVSPARTQKPAGAAQTGEASRRGQKGEWKQSELKVAPRRQGSSNAAARD
ncbi:hypothetical protein KUCAC02_023387 [Chaenocephalus aceratus]|uniref:Uncharacterized protein n=1 Tax=Chaenocephalus aceratus TaxID=36190 RepID=A0ACB9XR63_CHAAC|nr:hypothetical protein KUCAC02_023387 [Chaenocephalus aceratus]